jgi:hypothetical protein
LEVEVHSTIKQTLTVCKAHVFDETFGVNSTFNAEVFVAAPHGIAMESDLFGESRSPDALGLG